MGRKAKVVTSATSKAKRGREAVTTKKTIRSSTPNERAIDAVTTIKTATTVTIIKERRAARVTTSRTHGRYAKGHSTKGHHNIHKLDEYKKNTDFFNEDDDQAFEERHGGYEATKAVARGGHNAGGHFKKAFLEGRYGLAGFADKGTHYFDDKGHKKATGQDGYYGHHAQFAQNGGQDGFKKFGYAKLNAQ
jgi:hypothetical protein